jgi:hypothetical protein
VLGHGSASSPSSASSGCRRCAESTVATDVADPTRFAGLRGLNAVEVCENCTAEEEDLTSVWPVGEESSDAPQLWCPECIARYPNEPAEEE